MDKPDNKKTNTKSGRNFSETDLPDIKTNSSTTKTAVHRQGKIDGTKNDN